MHVKKYTSLLHLLKKKILTNHLSLPRKILRNKNRFHTEINNRTFWQSDFLNHSAVFRITFTIFQRLHHVAMQNPETFFYFLADKLEWKFQKRNSYFEWTSIEHWGIYKFWVIKQNAAGYLGTDQIVYLLYGSFISL